MTTTRSSLLLADLRAYAALDETEVSNVAALESLLDSAGDEAFSRSHFLPGHVTASAFIVDRGSLRLLLHHHRRLDRWLQMGGHVDPGESPEEAARREAREESGLDDLELDSDTFFDVDVHAIPAKGAEPLHNHFDVRYLFFTSKPERVKTNDQESHGFAWVPLAEAAALVGDVGCERAIGKIERSIESRRR